MISREQFDTLTPEPPVDPNQEVPPGPPKFQQGKSLFYIFYCNVSGFALNNHLWLQASRPRIVPHLLCPPLISSSTVSSNEGLYGSYIRGHLFVLMGTVPLSRQRKGVFTLQFLGR